MLTLPTPFHPTLRIEVVVHLEPVPLIVTVPVHETLYPRYPPVLLVVLPASIVIRLALPYPQYAKGGSSLMPKGRCSGVARI
jgi:hypothetical protein